MALATYFRENLSDRYVTTGPPNIGEFGRDLKVFLESSVSLGQRAKKLMELQHKWNKLNTEAGEDSSEEKIDTGNN